MRPLFRSARDAAWALIACASMAVLAPSPARGDVLMQHNDVGRSGATLIETQLTTSNVVASKFGKLFTRAVNGSIYAQPLYVSSLAMPVLAE